MDRCPAERHWESALHWPVCFSLKPPFLSFPNLPNPLAQSHPSSLGFSTSFLVVPSLFQASLKLCFPLGLKILGRKPQVTSPLGLFEVNMLSLPPGYKLFGVVCLCFYLFVFLCHFYHVPCLL